MYCPTTQASQVHNKVIRTLVWQGETPSHQTLRSDLNRYFSNQGIVGWCPELRCWLVRVPVHKLQPVVKVALYFGISAPGEGRDWFEIRITPADTFLTISTCGRNVFIEAFASGLAKYFVLARNAVIVSE